MWCTVTSGLEFAAASELASKLGCACTKHQGSISFVLSDTSPQTVATLASCRSVEYVYAVLTQVWPAVSRQLHRPVVTADDCCCR